MNLSSTAIKHHQIAVKAAGKQPVHQWAKRNQNAAGKVGHRARMISAMHALHTQDAAEGARQQMDDSTNFQEGPEGQDQGPSMDPQSAGA